MQSPLKQTTIENGSIAEFGMVDEQAKEFPTWQQLGTVDCPFLNWNELAETRFSLPDQV